MKYLIELIDDVEVSLGGDDSRTVPSGTILEFDTMTMLAKNDEYAFYFISLDDAIECSTKVEDE